MHKIRQQLHNSSLSCMPIVPYLSASCLLLQNSKPRLVLNDCGYDITPNKKLSSVFNCTKFRIICDHLNVVVCRLGNHSTRYKTNYLNTRHAGT